MAHKYKESLRHMCAEKVAAKYRNRDPYPEAWVVAKAVQRALVPECKRFIKVQGSSEGISFSLGDATDMLIRSYCDITDEDGWANITRGAPGSEEDVIAKVIRKHYAKKLEPCLEGLRSFTVKHEHRFFCMLLNPEYCHFAGVQRLTGSSQALSKPGTSDVHQNQLWWSTW